MFIVDCHCVERAARIRQKSFGKDHQSKYLNSRGNDIGIIVPQDKEVACGGSAPRILALDSYFLNEVEKTMKDPETGRR